jgi:hypothetical protein
MFSKASRHPLPSARVLNVMSSLSSLSTSSQVPPPGGSGASGASGAGDDVVAAILLLLLLLLGLPPSSPALPWPAAAAATADRCGRGPERVCRRARSALASRAGEEVARRRGAARIRWGSWSGVCVSVLLCLSPAPRVQERRRTERARAQW